LRTSSTFLHDQEQKLAAQLADPVDSFDPPALATVAGRLREPSFV